jgi:hypothetical protein
MCAAALSGVAASMLAAQTPTPARTGAAGAASFVAIGCVSRETAAGTRAPLFVITDTRGEKPTMYRLDGDAATLAFHVGHTVEVAGPITSSARTGAKVMKVVRLIYLSKSCPQTKPAGK